MVSSISLLQMTGYCFVHYFNTMGVSQSMRNVFLYLLFNNGCVQHFKQHKTALFKQCLKAHTGPIGAGPIEEGVSGFKIGPLL